MNTETTRDINAVIYCTFVDLIMLIISFSFSTLINVLFGITPWMTVEISNMYMIIFFIFLVIFLTGFDMYNMILFPPKENFMTILLACVYSGIFCYVITIFLYGAKGILFVLISTVLSIFSIFIWRNLRYIYYKNIGKEIHLAILEAKSEDNSKARRLKYSCLNQYDSWYEQIDVNDKDSVGRFTKNELPKYDGICITESIPAEIKDILVSEIIKAGKELFIIPGSYDINLVKVGLVRFDDVLAFRIKPTGLNMRQKATKRILDVIFSIILIIITIIPMALIGLITYLTTFGSAVVKKKYLTLHQKEFELYNFSTSKRKTENTTVFGRFLIKTNMVGLPSLFNVLKGDISIVGPGLARQSTVDKYINDIEDYVQRFDVKAGLTSLSYVYGRNNSTMSDRTLYELMYIRNYGIFLDLKIILLTTKMVFMKDSREGIDNSDPYKNRRISI